MWGCVNAATTSTDFFFVAADLPTVAASQWPYATAASTKKVFGVVKAAATVLELEKAKLLLLARPNHIWVGRRRSIDVYFLAWTYSPSHCA